MVIIGDSIALGIAEYMRPPAYVSAKIGASSLEIADFLIDETKDAIIIISAGSNDPMNHSLAQNLDRLRRKFCGRKVIWIVPRNERAAEIVRGIARLFKDATVEFVPAGDGIHPRNYGAVIKSIKEKI